jgi:hypothetical protein
MELPYYNFLLSDFQGESSQHAMAPPPPPRPAATQHQPGYVRQNHPSHNVGRGLHAASDLYTNPVNHGWQSLGDTFTARPPPPRVDFANAAEGSIRPVRSSTHAQSTSGRTMSITAAEWMKHKSTIHKLWIEEDRALPETMAIMLEKHQFQATYVFLLPAKPGTIVYKVLMMIEKCRSIQKADHKMEMVKVHSNQGW